MFSFLISSVFVLLLNSTVGFAKTNSSNHRNQEIKNSALSEQSLTEELTGKKESPKMLITDLKNIPLSEQHLIAGQKAAAAKDYILAIKHFNTVIQNYPQSAQVRQSLFAKAKIYQEMGLQPQAERNLKLAQLKTKTSVSKTASHHEQNKITK